ncbi:MAG: BACON domain-containing protein, partial [Alistipes sp.]|nr:BACON domain-containing protein [Alistipes sp.]
MSKLLLVVLCLLAWVRCSDNPKIDKGEQHSIETSKDRFEISYEQLVMDVMITSTCSWEAKCDSDWVDVITTKGIAGVEKLSVEVQYNSSQEERKATITIKNE